MYLGTVSAYPKIQIWGKIENRKNPGFWPSPAPGDLIWVTLGQETYCIDEFREHSRQKRQEGPSAATVGVPTLLVLLWRHKVSTILCPKPLNSANSVFKYIFGHIYGHIWTYIYIYIYIYVYVFLEGLILFHHLQR